MNKIAAIKPGKYFFLLLFLALAKGGQAQQAAAKPPTLYDSTTIDAKLLVGIWETADSSKSKIELVDAYFEIVLHPGPHLQPYFFSKDTLNKVSTSGYYPNWPPFNCNLKMSDCNTLEITYSQLGVPPHSVKYVKVKQ